MSKASEKIHVVLLTDCLAGLTGGAERQIYELAREIDKSRFDLTVVSLECGESTPPEIIDNIGCEVKLFPIRRIYSFNGIRQGRKFGRWLRENRTDILMTYHFSSDMWGAYFAHAAGVKHIISNRRDMGFWRRFHHDAAYKAANRWVERIVTNSRAIKEKVKEAECFPPERIQVIYNGINGLSGYPSAGRNAVRNSIRSNAPAHAPLTCSMSSRDSLSTNSDASFVTQFIGVVSIGAFVAIASLIVWMIIKLTIGIRASEEEEAIGLDRAELGLEAYPEFGRGSQIA